MQSALSSTVASCIGALAGIRDALSFHLVFWFFIRSETIRSRTIACSLLNGVVFLGSMVLVQFIIQPLARSTLGLLGIDAIGFDALFTGLYYVFWLWPVYCISFVVSGFWYSDIAEEAHRMLHGKAAPKGLKESKRFVVGEVYRALLFGVMLMFSVVATFLPKVGFVVSFLLLSWFNAFYIVDYTWSSAGDQLATRLTRFERNWPYFAGFGAPITALTMMFPFLASSGILALLFPFLELLAASAKIPTISNDIPEFALFRPAQVVADAIVRILLPVRAAPTRAR